MTNDCAFSISTTRFDENYSPSAASRTTTNFANLARGENRQQNLRNAMAMINNRCNDLLRWDNPSRDRYRVELDIVTVNLDLSTVDADSSFPIIEILDVQILDTETGERTPGIAGNNFSSYIRDYDFSVLLAKHAASGATTVVPEGYGELHGKIFQKFLDSSAYRDRFAQDPVICISVSTSRTYRRLVNEHPVLGIEYQQDAYSLTDEYFAKMGLSVRYFMPPGAVSPLAFYHRGDLLNDYSPRALAATISTMESFQKIYRPEIYNANSVASDVYRPSLQHGDFSPTQIEYDRVERSQLATVQGKSTEENLMVPYGDFLERWVAEPALATV